MGAGFPCLLINDFWSLFNEVLPFDLERSLKGDAWRLWEGKEPFLKKATMLGRSVEGEVKMQDQPPFEVLGLQESSSK